VIFPLGQKRVLTKWIHDRLIVTDWSISYDFLIIWSEAIQRTDQENKNNDLKICLALHRFLPSAALAGSERLGPAPHLFSRSR
jgi:hypothetical protein